MKLRYFYKLDHKKQPIPGSNVRRKSIPGPKSQWKEILLPCCETTEVDCTCGPRYFVQLDGGNRPVDGTLIKRINGDKPTQTDGLRLQEIQWKPGCCGILNYSFVSALPAVGTFQIVINGVTKVDLEHTSTLTESGSVNFRIGDNIQVVFGSNDLYTQLLSVTGGHTYSSGETLSDINHSWTPTTSTTINLVAQIVEL